MDGIIGELVVRGSNVMRGYWNAPELTKTVFKNEGILGERYLYTGDLFHKDKEGFLYFHGRKDDLIKTKGERVSPKEIENVIYKIEDVIEAAVIGIPDEILGNALEAFIVKKNGSPLNEKDIQKFCSERLENFMVPKYVVFISELPKTENGKINRKAIKELKHELFTN